MQSRVGVKMIFPKSRSAIRLFTIDAVNRGCLKDALTHLLNQTATHMKTRSATAVLAVIASCGLFTIRIGLPLNARSKDWRNGNAIANSHLRRRINPCGHWLFVDGSASRVQPECNLLATV